MWHTLFYFTSLCIFSALSSVLNSAAVIAFVSCHIYGLRHSDHISDALISLYWLWAPERVRFNTAVLMYKATHANCAIIPDSTGSCRRSAWSTFPPLCSDQSSAGAVRETVYRRRLGLPGRRTHHLEQPAGQRDISPVSVNLPSAFKNISVPGLIP